MHTIKISVDVKGVQFYGFRVCSSFSEKPSAGEATYTFSPRQFKDVEGNMVGPERGFRLTLEMLRRKPDSALIWYEDFRDYGVLETNYWTTLSGSYTVWRSDESLSFWGEKKLSMNTCLKRQRASDVKNVPRRKFPD